MFVWALRRGSTGQYLANPNGLAGRVEIGNGTINVMFKSLAYVSVKLVETDYVNHLAFF